VVCGGTQMETICSAEEIAIQLAYLPRFHKRRLRRGATREDLEERAHFTQDYATQIVRCRACGLLLRDPRPSDSQIARMYSQDEYGHERLEEIFPAQRALYRPKARFLAHWLKPGARVVEVGSFVGGFLAAGRELGCEMLGVDPGAEVAAFCWDRGFPVLQGALADLRLPPGSVDAIAVWNTFDQLPDPMPTLHSAVRLLRPKGLLALRVPNGEFFESASRALKKMRHTPLAPVAGWVLNAMVWNNMLAFPYLYGYSVGTLDRLLAANGFTRRRATPDTLVQLSDRQTKPWAVWEERSIKLVQRAIARIDAARPNSRLHTAPWLDLYYEKTA